MPPTDIYIIGPDTSDPSPDRLNLLNWWRLVYGREGEQFGGNETGSRERGRERERGRSAHVQYITPPFSVLHSPSIHGATKTDQIWDPAADTLSEQRGQCDDPVG